MTGATTTVVEENLKMSELSKEIEYVGAKIALVFRSMEARKAVQATRRLRKLLYLLEKVEARVGVSQEGVS